MTHMSILTSCWDAKELASYKLLATNLLQFVDLDCSTNAIGSLQAFTRNCMQDLYILMADGFSLNSNQQLNMLYPLKKPLELLNTIVNSILSSDADYRSSQAVVLNNDLFMKKDIRESLLLKLKQPPLVLPNHLVLAIISQLALIQIDSTLIEHVLEHISKPLLGDLLNNIKYGCDSLSPCGLDEIHDKLLFITKYTKYQSIYDNDHWIQFVNDHFTITPSIFASYCCNNKQSKLDIYSSISSIYLQANIILINEIKQSHLFEWLLARKYYFLLLPSDSIEYFIHLAYNELNIQQQSASTNRLQLLYESCHRLIYSYPKVKKRSKRRGYMIDETNNTPNKSNPSILNRLTTHTLLDLIRLEYQSNDLIGLIMDESIEQCYRNLFEYQWLLRISMYELKQCKPTNKSLLINLNYIKHVITTMTIYTGEILEHYWAEMINKMHLSVEISDLKFIHQSMLIRMSQNCFLPVDDVMLVLDLMRCTRELGIMIQREQDVVELLMMWRSKLDIFKEWIKNACQENDSEWTMRVNGLLARLDYSNFFSK
eukprot:NODE_70_length_23697_cov_0.294771.p5 type:complete len:542 gc:universal NODE_70_length_23697_cov_0.294771:11392-9767(-)